MFRWMMPLAGLVAALPALAADLPARDAAPTPTLAPAAFTWTGFYLGANLGYGFAAGGNRFDPDFGAVTGLRGGGGAVGGGQVGYNYQFTPGSGLVLGLEADIQAAKLGQGRAGLIGTTPYLDVTPRLDYFGTVRGRVGYAFDRLLAYGTGGFAYGGGGSRPAFAAIYPNALPHETGTGYAVGGGLEYALTKRISARIEALYVDLDHGRRGATAYDAATGAYYGTGRARNEFGVVRAGLNYRFSTD